MTSTAATPAHFHRDWLNRGVYGLQPVGTRWVRNPTIAEVVHFETCHAAGPYSAVNVKVPRPVPVWQYVDQQDRNHAARISARQQAAEAAFARTSLMNATNLA